jgi:DNA-binding XRE family transcriptional regulator
MKRKPVLIDAKEFGARLREARIKSGKKQLEVAKSVGLAPNSISYHEQGHSIPSLDLAVQLSCCLNVSLEYLVGLKNEP